MIAIYRASNLFFFIALFLASFEALASTSFNSFCFENSVDLKDVQRSIGFLLLPRDVVELRNADHCIDISVSPDRVKLFEKYLSGRYNLKAEVGASTNSGTEVLENTSCKLNLKTTTQNKLKANTFKFGEKKVLNTTESSSSNVTQMEMLLGAGLPGEIEAGTARLKVICSLINEDNANLVFSFIDKTKTSVSTEVRVRKGEWLNIASVVKDLNDKIKTLGIPQTEISDTSGKNETVYELQLK